MTQSERIDTFTALGDFMRHPAHQNELEQLAQQAYLRNHWFTPDNVRNALNAIANQFLDSDLLRAWLAPYPADPVNLKTVGVVLAGNIPAVGFHDLLCVLLSGHRVMIKLSQSDFVLIHYLIQKIVDLNPAFASYIDEAERLNAADAYIATGSDNTARYFHYYFGKKPHIIRKNRSSVGILSGFETEADLEALGNDMLTYFGLGCRNVSTLFVPEEYDLTSVLRTLEFRRDTFVNHHKYLNNYEYNKSIYLINAVPHYDNGFQLYTENPALVSPISVIYYQKYQHLEHLKTLLATNADKIQLIASAHRGDGPGWYAHSVSFGQTQYPRLTDYADGVDTMAFLGETGAL